MSKIRVGRKFYPEGSILKGPLRWQTQRLGAAVPHFSFDNKTTLCGARITSETYPVTEEEAACQNCLTRLASLRKRHLYDPERRLLIDLKSQS
jgi:hypothetical protein